MSAGTIAALSAAAFLFLLTGAAGAMIVMAILRDGKCACGHPYGCVDRYTGKCTGTVVETHFVGGVRRTRKRVPCSCLAHRESVFAGSLADVRATLSEPAGDAS